MHATKITLAMEQEPMHQVVKKVVHHQDQENIEQDFPDRLCLQGDDKGLNQHIKPQRQGDAYFLAGLHSVMVLLALLAPFFPVLRVIMLSGVGDSRDAKHDALAQYCGYPKAAAMVMPMESAIAEAQKELEGTEPGDAGQ